MPKRRNQRPEKYLTVDPCLTWLDENDFSCHVVESKAVFSRAANRYLRGQTAPGFSDIAGCTPIGFGCFIEAKAPGKRSTLSDQQREFLTEKIRRRCFAVCVDSVEQLRDLYISWVSYPPSIARNFLIESLPKKRVPPVKVTTLE